MKKFEQAERAELWERWKRGESLSDIARVLNRRPASIFQVVAPRGGFAPRERSRSKGALTKEEREEISRGISARLSLRRIATTLGRPQSTVAREIARNGGRDAYRASAADLQAWKRAERPKPFKLALNPRLCGEVAEKLLCQWSPEQIAGWLRETYPSEPSMQVSHETIYRSLFIQARGLLKKELVNGLRTQRATRRPRRPEGLPTGGVQFPEALSIRKRPAEVEDRAIPGHWEGDLIVGGNNSYIATVVERATRFVKLVKVNGKDAASVSAALQREMVGFPAQLRRSLTWDRGAELAHHDRISVGTDLKIYFCDPSSPWQRGTNENTNGLLRQYFPKGMDLSGLSQQELDLVALRLNQRPRKTLGFKTPAYKLNAFIEALAP